MPHQRDYSLLYIAIFAILFFSLIGGVVFFQAHMEAKTYNKLTGSNATWWDAMWVELRVTRE
jgi:hypothetical protein